MISWMARPIASFTSNRWAVSPGLHSKEFERSLEARRQAGVVASNVGGTREVARMEDALS